VCVWGGVETCCAAHSRELVYSVFCEARGAFLLVAGARLAWGGARGPWGVPMGGGEMQMGSAPKLASITDADARHGLATGA